ncbi:MAG: hypothetical protein ACREJN_20975 [Nitrospiraceae bacterium]
MKTQTSKQTTEKKPRASLAKQSAESATQDESARPARPSFDDLQARITVRAYELYAERGTGTAARWEIGWMPSGKF